MTFLSAFGSFAAQQDFQDRIFSAMKIVRLQMELVVGLTCRHWIGIHTVQVPLLPEKSMFVEPNVFGWVSRIQPKLFYRLADNRYHPVSRALLHSEFPHRCVFPPVFHHVSIQNGDESLQVRIPCRPHVL